jgi:hypothetical protein
VARTHTCPIFAYPRYAGPAGGFQPSQSTAPNASIVGRHLLTNSRASFSSCKVYVLAAGLPMKVGVQPPRERVIAGSVVAYAVGIDARLGRSLASAVLQPTRSSLISTASRFEISVASAARSGASARRFMTVPGVS